TPNGIAEIPLTPLAIEALKSQMMISGIGPFLFPSDKNPSGHQRNLKTAWRKTLNVQEFPTLGSMTCAPPMQLDSAQAVSPTSGLHSSSGRATPRSSRSIRR